MIEKEKLKQHAALFSKMAQAAGLETETALISGAWLSPGDISDAVLRCTQCAGVKHCERWLASVDTADNAAPGFCRNRDLFAELRGKPGS